MQFIQFVFQTVNPQTKEVFHRYKTINASHIVEVYAGEGWGCNEYFVKTSLGDYISLCQRSYYTLINLLSSSWEGIKVMMVKPIENKDYGTQE